uniref:hypothetical protein n=1 Tax=Yoonia sp. TaxID=2212373 RepID=UPI004048EA6E
MMPAEEIAGVVFPAWDPTEFVRTFSELNWAEVVADLQPIVDRLILIGALEPEFVL